MNTGSILEDNNALEECFTMPELCAAIKRAKPKKQPGPDGITMELVKWLDNANRRALLDLINTWWESQTAPSALFLARVVPIFKKGDTDIAANYRPISLLNSFYKIYMVMIRARMQDAAEQVLSRTQYGFRPHRSTSHAIYILRRIQDYSEIKGTHLSIVLLDWEKRLIKFNMTSLFLLCADWASAVAILRSLRIVILSLCFSSKIVLVHLVLSNRPPGFVKDVHYPHFFLS